MFHIRKTRAADCENMSFDVDQLNRASENVPVTNKELILHELLYLICCQLARKWPCFRIPSQRTHHRFRLVVIRRRLVSLLQRSDWICALSPEGVHFTSGVQNTAQQVTGARQRVPNLFSCPRRFFFWFF